MELGTTIKELRKKKGMKQGEFAKRIGISPTSLSHIETNHTRPKKSTLEMICSELEIPDHLLYLLSLNEEDVPKGNEKLYEMMYPQLKEWMINIFYENDEKQLIK